MLLREFKAQIVDDFKSEWLALVALDESFPIESAIDAYGGEDLDALSKRISGEIVTITENTYPAGKNDFFESIDNSFVIYPQLFTEI